MIPSPGIAYATKHIATWAGANYPEELPPRSHVFLASHDHYMSSRFVFDYVRHSRRDVHLYWMERLAHGSAFFYPRWTRTITHCFLTL